MTSLATVSLGGEAAADSQLGDDSGFVAAVQRSETLSSRPGATVRDSRSALTGRRANDHRFVRSQARDSAGGRAIGHPAD